MPQGALPFAPSGYPTQPGGFGGGVDEFILDAPILLGSGGGMVWTPVECFTRALVTDFVISTSSTSWSLQVTGSPAGTGRTWLRAVNVSGTYSLSWPWRFKNTDDPQSDMMYIGVGDNSSLVVPPTFTLQAMEAEVFG